MGSRNMTNLFIYKVILTTQYTKSMSDSLKSELKFLLAQKAHFDIFLIIYFISMQYANKI